MWMNAPEMRAASIEPGLFVFLHQAVMEGKSSCMQPAGCTGSRTTTTPKTQGHSGARGKQSQPRRRAFHLHGHIMSAVLMTTDECPKCGVAPEDVNNMRTEIERLRATLRKIAFEPFGPAETSATRVLLLITELARETLKPRPAARARPRSTEAHLGRASVSTPAS
jgi:hypothetical protein